MSHWGLPVRYTAMLGVGLLELALHLKGDHDARSYELISRVFAGESAGLTRDDILDYITITWLANTALSGAGLYWENWANSGISMPNASPFRLP